MANLKPKKIDELSPLEKEDAYKTPIRRSFSETTGKKEFFLKRISELSPLESSDDDERTSPNTAFLNNSFIEISPVKDDPGVENNQNQINNNENNIASSQNVYSKTPPKPALLSETQTKRDSGPRQLNFAKALNDVSSNESNRPKIGLFSKMQTTKNTDDNKSITVAPEKSKIIESLNASVEALSVKRCISAPSKSSEINTSIPVASAQPNDSKSIIDDDTPYKDFQMPSAATLRRLQSSQHRGLSTSRNLEEFKSQKVLFTTPSAVSRPAMKFMNNLGLDDSLNCYKSPMTIPVPAKEVVKRSSLETKLSESEPQKDSIDGVTKTDEAENPSEKQKILRINGKNFIVREKIGSGGSSSVFLAEHKETKLECALKVVNLRADPALVEGFIKEVKILAMLQDKVNVIRLYEYALVSSESMLYMVMEKGDSDLRKILSTYKSSLPLYVLMTYWHQMLQSVNYIHKNDVIHSDLKPENFLMVRGRLKLTDFGISSKMAVDATSIIKFSQVGTFNYISPEALMDTSTGDSPIAKKNQPKIKISPKSDVWSLGCILYLLLYKRTPFAHIKNIYAKMQAIINPTTQIEYPELPKYYPAMLIEMVQLCLKHNPKERPTVADLLNFPSKHSS